MSTHDFEKQGQQKTDGLKFVPSEAVWEEVAKQIQERRERRRLLIWWLLFPLIAGGSFSIYITTRPVGKKTGPALAIQSAGVKAASPVHTSSNNSNNNTGTAVAETATTTTNNNNNNEPTHAAVSGTPAVVAPPVPVFAATAVAGRNKLMPIDKRVSKAANDEARSRMVVKKQLVVAKDGQVPEMEPLVTEEASMRRAGVTPIGNMLFSIQIMATPTARLTKADSAATVKTPVQHKKKMEWVVTADAGGAGISSGFSVLKSNATGYVNDVPSSLLTTANPGTTASGRHNPSAIKPGPAFTAGLSARRWLGRKFSLEAGVQYSYYSTSISAGSRVDSSTTVRQGAQYVSSYYLNSSGVTMSTSSFANYTNRYHFIEIPLRAQQQLGNRSPLSLNAGLNIGRFIGSNALQYDAAKNVYYKDNSIFNKTQLSLSAGMDIRLWRNKPVAMEIGPRLQYGITNLFKQQVYGNRHLLFAGLELRLSFGKK